MPDRSRIPRKVADCHAYINNSTNYLEQKSTIIPRHMESLSPDVPENWQRLGILPSQMRVYHTLVAQWNILFKLYSNENSRSPAIENELTGIQLKLTEFIEQFPDLVSAMENRQPG